MFRLKNLCDLFSAENHINKNMKNSKKELFYFFILT